VEEELVYRIRCLFCKRDHVSPYFDEIEEEILACRDRAPDWQRGDLAGFKDPGMRPVSPETEARAGVDTVGAYWG
jgi:hypothetical protein